jgi:hypothetical protein
MTPSLDVPEFEKFQPKTAANLLPPKYSSINACSPRGYFGEQNEIRSARYNSSRRWMSADSRESIDWSLDGE